MEVLNLLEGKNEILRRFLDSSIDFLELAQAGSFDSLASFHTWRESSLKTLERLDQKLTSAVNSVAQDQKTPALIQAVEKALLEKDAVLKCIFQTDQKIMNLLESEKNRISGAISQTKKMKTTVQKFKSAWIGEAGEGLDKKL